MMPEKEKELAPIKTIGVLPAQAASLAKQSTDNPAELQPGVETFNMLLAEHFSNSQDTKLISQSAVQGLSSATPGMPLHIAREAGKQFNFDAILVTSVERYRERDGSEYVVKEPASVAFSLRLLEVSSGRIIWSSDFDQTQKPLFENILPETRSTGSGFRWLTAAELASAGLTKKLKSSPYLLKN
jgi:hypothetical protein